MPRNAAPALKDRAKLIPPLRGEGLPLSACCSQLAALSLPLSACRSQLAALSLLLSACCSQPRSGLKDLPAFFSQTLVLIDYTGFTRIIPASPGFYHGLTP
jgi:hypothetical protein